jgi:hypothetical protein
MLVVQSRVIGAVLSAVFMSLICGNGIGGLICLPPTPYRSPQDSPFVRTGTNGSTFYVMDLESNFLAFSNSVRSPEGVSIGPVHVREPGEFTDSVDADDGLVDGHGNRGHSLIPAEVVSYPTLPITLESRMSVLQTNPSGFHANAFGFVWTDGHMDSEISFVIPSTSERCEFHDLMDSWNTGQTQEDVFIGVVWDRPIVELRVTVTSHSFQPFSEALEFDHIQYGMQAIPEPTAQIPFLTCQLLVIARFQKRRQRRCTVAA